MTQITDEQIRNHLAATGRIALIWGIDDVQAVRPDLNDEQCMAVLCECLRLHDAGRGLNWTVIDVQADTLFPHLAATAVLCRIAGRT